MATYTEIYNRVLKNVIDVNAGLTAEVKRWIQDAQGDIEDRHKFRAMEETVGPVVTAVGVRTLSVAKPALWKETRSTPYYAGGYGKTTEMDYLEAGRDETVLFDEFDPLDIGSPKFIVERDATFDVYPLPDDLAPKDTAIPPAVSNDGNYRIYIPYWSRLALLGDGVGEVESNWFTTDAAEYLEYTATYRALRFNRDPEALSVRFEAEEEMRRVIRQDKKSRIPRELTMRPRRDARAGSRQLRM